jgi:hypothetical protein
MLVVASISHGDKHSPAHKKKSASELYRPSDRRLSAKRLPTFADKGCHVVSVTDPYGRIHGSLDSSGYCIPIIELRQRNSVDLENWEYGRGDLVRWPRDILYPQKLALTSPCNGCRLVGTVCLLTKATELYLLYKEFHNLEYYDKFLALLINFMELSPFLRGH